MNAAVFAGHEQLVDEKLIGVRRLRRHDDKHLIDVGYGRAAEAVPPRQLLFDNALSAA